MLNRFRRSCYFIIMFVMLASVFLVGCGSEGASKDSNGGNSEEKVLNVFNWSDYFPPSVIKQFEEETGIQVNYDTFSSSEEMYAKLSLGNSVYDITTAINNVAELLLLEDGLEKVNKENVPNLKNIGPEFFGLFPDLDPNDDYIVPYLWGFDPIAINEEIVDFEVEGYEDLFDPSFKNNLVVTDEPRTIIGMMLMTLGYSVNSENEEEIKEAGELLNKLKPNIKAVDTESKNFIVSNETMGVITYSGDLALAKRENPNIKTVFPKEGLLVWQDNLVIPKGAPHKENAEKFIDFIHRPEIMKEIVMDYPYGTTNSEALKLLPEDIKKDIQFEEEYKQGEFLKDVGEATPIYDRIWTEFRQ